MKTRTELRIRYYSNKESVTITALKVGSRFCDHYYGVTSAEPEIYIAPDNSFVEGKIYEKKYKETPKLKIGKTDLFKPIYDILEGKEKRKVFLFYRDPHERAVAVTNHFFNAWMSARLNKHMVGAQFPVVADYEFEPYKDNKPIENRPELLKAINELSMRFVDFTLTRNINDTHLAPYMFIHYMILMSKQPKKNLVLCNIDKERMENVFDIPLTNLKNFGGMKSNPHTKPAMRGAFSKGRAQNYIDAFTYSEDFFFNLLEEHRNKNKLV